MDDKWRALIVIGIILLMASLDEAHASAATMESKAPWTIARCDRLTGQRAVAVFNRSVFARGGWPLWRVVCLYR